jgi:hypothetical protein
VLWIVAAAALAISIAAVALLALHKPINGPDGPTGPQGVRGMEATLEPPPWQSMMFVYKNYLDPEGKDPAGKQIVPQRSIVVDNTGPYFAAGEQTLQGKSGWLVQTQPLTCQESGRYVFTGAVFVAFPQAPGRVDADRPDADPPNKRRRDRFVVAVRWTPGEPSEERGGNRVFDTILFQQEEEVGFLRTTPLGAFTVDMAAGDVLFVDVYTEFIYPTKSDPLEWNVGAAVQLDILPAAFGPDRL